MHVNRAPRLTATGATAAHIGTDEHEGLRRLPALRLAINSAVPADSPSPDNTPDVGAPWVLGCSQHQTDSYLSAWT
jgi:hypothetical protein